MAVQSQDRQAQALERIADTLEQILEAMRAPAQLADIKDQASKVIKK